MDTFVSVPLINTSQAPHTFFHEPTCESFARAASHPRGERAGASPVAQRTDGCSGQPFSLRATARPSTALIGAGLVSRHCLGARDRRQIVSGSVRNGVLGPTPLTSRGRSEHGPIRVHSILPSSSSALERAIHVARSRNSELNGQCLPPGVLALDEFENQRARMLFRVGIRKRCPLRKILA